MLVLSRKVAQRIRIGNDIIITIISLGKSVVDLGIDAPKNVKILRDELSDKIPNTKETLCQSRCANSCLASSCCSSDSACVPMRKTGGEL